MTVTLHLGVIDLPYVEREPPAKMRARIARNAKKVRPRPERAEASEKTTGDVAAILEARYGLMEAFFENKEEAIVGFLAESVADAINSIVEGAPLTLDPFSAGAAKVEEAFKDFLSTREAEKIGIEGTPTAAALAGVNHRLKHPYAKANKRRPSFIDTGLMQSAFKAWVTF